MKESNARLGVVTCVAEAILWCGGGTPILAYQKVAQLPATARARGLYISPRRFAQQIGGLRSAGFTCVGLDELEAPSAFSLTIDGGFASTMEHALPALQANGLTATLFVASGCLGGWNEWETAQGEEPCRLMDEAQIRDWLAAGQRLGSLGISCTDLTRLPRTVLRDELQASRADLEDRFGRAVEELAYPFGAHDELVCATAAECGYLRAVTLTPRASSPSDDPLRLPRLLGRNRRRLLELAQPVKYGEGR